MSLTSLVFALFCIITLIIYFLVPKKIQWIVLLASSLVFLFYDNLSIGTVVQALIVLLSTYIFGILIEKYKNDKKSKIFLIIGILIILGQLFYLKYTNLFLNTANHILDLLNVKYTFTLVEKNSLVGISYYSLIMIGYLIDIYRRSM